MLTGRQDQRQQTPAKALAHSSKMWNNAAASTPQILTHARPTVTAAATRTEQRCSCQQELRALSTTQYSPQAQAALLRQVRWAEH
jgi:hypothetical protein